MNSDSDYVIRTDPLLVLEASIKDVERIQKFLEAEFKVLKVICDDNSTGLGCFNRTIEAMVEQAEPIFGKRGPATTLIENLSAILPSEFIKRKERFYG